MKIGKFCRCDILISIIGLIFGYSIVSAQNISISASVDKNRVTLNEQLVLRVVVSGDVSDMPNPTLPGLSGFTAYSSGRSQNISIVNGKVSSSISFDYVLVPNSPGTHIIGSVVLDFRGNVYKTDPITVEVVQGSAAQSPPGQQSPPQTQTTPVQSEGKNIFITTSVDKKTAYVNDQITLIFRLYHRVRILSQPQYQPPSATGFWIEDLPPQREYRTTVDGREYHVVELKTAIFPTAPGDYTISSAMLKCAVEDVGAQGDPFAQFFSQGKTVTLNSDPIKIKVLPLPEENKPSEFKGGVGRYRITAKADKTKVQTNEPVTLDVTIAGMGNIKTVTEPVLPGLNNFKRYETVSSLNISKQDYIVQGSKTFKIVLSPKVSGRQTVLSVKFAFFDPVEKTYKTLQTQPIELTVTPGPKEEGISKTVTPEGIKIIITDVRYIKTDVRIRNEGQLLYRNPFFVIFNIFPALVFALSLVYKTKQDKLSKDIRYARFSRAYRNFNKKFKESQKLLDSQQISALYSLLSDVFVKYLADKLNLPPAGLILNTVVEKLRLMQIDIELIEQIKNLWQEFEFARFAPSQMEEEGAKSVSAKIKTLIDNLEKRL